MIGLNRPKRSKEEIEQEKLKAKRRAWYKSWYARNKEYRDKMQADYRDTHREEINRKQKERRDAKKLLTGE